MMDEPHLHEPLVPGPPNDPADGPKPGEGEDDADDANGESKEWDEEVAEEAGLTDEDSNPLPPT